MSSTAPCLDEPAAVCDGLLDALLRLADGLVVRGGEDLQQHQAGHHAVCTLVNTQSCATGAPSPLDHPAIGSARRSPGIRLQCYAACRGMQLTHRALGLRALVARLGASEDDPLEPARWSSDARWAPLQRLRLRACCSHLRLWSAPQPVLSCSRAQAPCERYSSPVPNGASTCLQPAHPSMFAEDAKLRPHPQAAAHGAVAGAAHLSGAHSQKKAPGAARRGVLAALGLVTLGALLGGGVLLAAGLAPWQSTAGLQPTAQQAAVLSPGKR